MFLNHVLISYTNWIQGEPDNFGGHEKCVLMYRAGDGASGWDDTECCLHRTYACEKVCIEMISLYVLYVASECSYHLSS